LDFTSGIGVTSLGHAHPDVTEAIIAQAQSIIHVQCAIGLSEPYVQLVESLLQMMPDPCLDSFFFASSGSEAIESAIKVVRTKTRRNNIIVMQGGYHGMYLSSCHLFRSDLHRPYIRRCSAYQIQDLFLQGHWTAHGTTHFEIPHFCPV
jgi:4-aminobutyrate aminotransferase